LNLLVAEPKVSRMTTQIEAGSMVRVRDTEGVEHLFEALSGVEEEGHTFPVVWVRRPLASGGEDRMPWPAEDVVPA
jgi:hypothetical protein